MAELQNQHETIVTQNASIGECDDASVPEVVEVADTYAIDAKCVDVEALAAFHRRRARAGWRLYQKVIESALLSAGYDSDTAKAVLREGDPGARDEMLKKLTKTSQDLAKVLSQAARAAKDLVTIERTIAGLSDSSGSVTVNAGVIQLPAKEGAASWEALARREQRRRENERGDDTDDVSESTQPGAQSPPPRKRGRPKGSKNKRPGG